MEIRNIAIIAHVDHGKTTLTDALMKQNGGSTDEGLSMDSNALEKERGITIYSKNTSIYFKDTKINIVDTPGHADFGSEVERVLRAVDSVLLLVDAVEGPMPQTRFVLKKSLELGLQPIVVINKIDKPAADPHRVHNEILELFFELGANEAQANFETVYTIGREGKAYKNLGDDSRDLSPLLDVILEKVIPASGRENEKMSAQVFNLGYDNFLGRMAVARIYSGSILSGSNIFIKGEKSVRKGKITKLFTFEGIIRKEVTTASSGDIVLLAGIPDIYIGETLCENENAEPLPHIAIDEPTLSLNFLVNDSPFAGREGKFVTSRQIKERLEKELEINVGLKVDFSPDQEEQKIGPSFFKVYGRGELHVAILLENMRREGFEVQVSEPEVIIKDNNGIKTEPYEELVIDVPMESSGTVIEKIGKRRGIMKDMMEKRGITRIIFDISTRGLLGYRGEFIIDTKGEGIMSSRVMGFREYAGEIKKREYGSMVSMISGKAVTFSLANLQERGILYIEHGVEVYEGMVIGNVLKGDDMSVNPTKGKQLTNMRASGTDEAITLNPVFTLNIERALEVMNDDEYLEITPKSVRLRKKYLTEIDRAKNKRK
ncbi:GTP-binding protein TypA [Candidatus Nomurabacteria bacterium RIFCSPHIGHO2_02_FULL_37_45]|uniref:50S ribosomal subunit assembly factor BipA n=1 Tax=Candidatus Nomurabacteria bacterium RIFCSPHIGHO2_12_FULL_37_29 TaxID=1801759 RepID=A0A1F6WBQ4_9BACT|nr:MAG: GTP-binding protein TypA [Candidatus Nomurabacteria bacterium RIFCSPHIGHO2_01_FULL_37_110]OGI71283.1 MAG: GTP-binding protein TypA [Candidatus Nomurabacteria bacterium RIFCSPHIGHO2_02_FULL_37_45]OGI79340.1 MAG: GTP-binding protein TypA [Candidatus Nomurabacteria bacterium RIFCSPHIGHO2_12_FULL_37_29]OGI84889.1 MAG: GTP-binding protein TypA [Candidatus Nomurabacteria bacterium RIFCSPLOWO2_01_FULL_37_49]